jgi:hypothetical protein
MPYRTDEQADAWIDELRQEIAELREETTKLRDLLGDVLDALDEQYPATKALYRVALAAIAVTPGANTSGRED